MNVAKTLSLFFIIFLFVKNENIIAQQKTDLDSSSYWIKAITQPDEVQDLTGGYLFFENATKKSLESNDTIEAIYNLSMLSIADFELDFLDDSEKDAIQALKLLDEMEMSKWKSEMTVSIYNSLGKTHRAQKDYENALNSYDKVLELTNVLSDSITAYNNKGNVYKDENKDQEALSNLLKLDDYVLYLEYINITDSLRQRKLEQDVKYSHAKYDIEKERQKTIAQKLQSDEEKKRQKLIFIGIGLLLLISAAFLFFLLKLKHKREKAREVIKETYQTERRLSKKVHDELANDLSDTLNLIDNHTAIPNDIKEQLVDKIDDLYDRTRDISAEIDGFDSKDFARSLKFLITQHNTEGVKVITNVTSGINWDTISDHKKINIYRSLQELLVNMKKYSKATEVTVIFKSEGKRHFINYTDNGVGVILKDIRKRGLQNVETRIKNIQGSITFKTSKGKGFKAHLYF